MYPSTLLLSYLILLAVCCREIKYLILSIYLMVASRPVEAFLERIMGIPGPNFSQDIFFSSSRQL
jgi:hypothetical protein